MTMASGSEVSLPEPGVIHLWHDTLEGGCVDAWSTFTAVLDLEERRK